MKREKLDQLRKQFMAGIWIGAGLLVFGVFERVPVFWVLGLILLGVSAFRLNRISRIQPQDDEESLKGKSGSRRFTQSYMGSDST